MKLPLWQSKTLEVVPLRALLLVAPAWTLNITGTAFEGVNYEGGVGRALAGATAYKPLHGRIERQRGGGIMTNELFNQWCERERLGDVA